MKKFRNKYRIPSARLPGWDYRNAGAYFITICTHNRLHFFGECHQKKMKLSTTGMIVQGCWYQIPFLNPHVSSGAFVVMPDHVHGILILDDIKHDGGDDMDTKYTGDMDDMDDMGVEAFDSNASTPISNAMTNKNPNINKKQNVNDDKNNATDTTTNEFYKTISPKSGSVSRIIQQYKTVCTKHIRLACPELDFKWQSRFYDHIIRNQKSFQNISNYIINNPKQWTGDKSYKS